MMTMDMTNDHGHDKHGHDKHGHDKHDDHGHDKHDDHGHHHDDHVHHETHMFGLTRSTRSYWLGKLKTHLSLQIQKMNQPMKKMQR